MVLPAGWDRPKEAVDPSEGMTEVGRLAWQECHGAAFLEKRL
jgi:hypothetical protein